MRAQNNGTEKRLLRKSLESFDTGIVKKLRRFQYWANKNFLIKKDAYLGSHHRSMVS